MRAIAAASGARVSRGACYGAVGPTRRPSLRQQCSRRSRTHVQWWAMLWSSQIEEDVRSGIMLRTYPCHARMSVSGIPMTITATTLRADLYRVIDNVLKTGVPVEVELRGRKVRIVPVEPR